MTNALERYLRRKESKDIELDLCKKVYEKHKNLETKYNITCKCLQCLYVRARM